MSKKVILKQVRSSNNREKHVRATLRALGLGRIGQKREHTLNPSTQGMMKAVQHLISVHESGK